MDYATLEDIDIMPYRMMERLIDKGNDNLWKLLKYDDINALKHSKLSQDEKSELIWTNQDQNKCRIFFTRTIEDQLPAEHAIIKIYSYKFAPIDPGRINVTWCWEILWGANQSVVYNEMNIPVNRGDLILHYIMECLNGKYVGGVGEIAFVQDKNRYAMGQSIIGNTTNYTGLMILLPTLAGGKGCCE